MTVKTYVKKPVIIEAVRFDGSSETAREVEMWADKEMPYKFDSQELLIPTMEGVMIASSGDFIIRGVKGEFYPCKPDIFDETYKLVGVL